MVVNNAARLIVNLPRFSRDRITPICIDLHFLPIRARIEFKICLLIFKAIKHGEPSYLSDLLTPYVPQSNINLRSSGRLYEPIISTLISSERCFEYHAPRLYNILPDDIKCLNSVETFKKTSKPTFSEKRITCLKKALIQNTVYELRSAACVLGIILVFRIQVLLLPRYFIYYFWYREYTPLMKLL